MVVVVVHEREHARVESRRTKTPKTLLLFFTLVLENLICVFKNGAIINTHLSLSLSLFSVGLLGRLGLL